MVERKKITHKTVLRIANSSVINGMRLHVLPRGDKWVVRKDGSIRATGIYLTKEQALSAAKNIVKGGGVPYAVVHDEFGKVTQRIS